MAGSEPEDWLTFTCKVDLGIPTGFECHITVDLEIAVEQAAEAAAEAARETAEAVNGLYEHYFAEMMWDHYSPVPPP